MLVPNQKVEINWNPFIQKYYQEKGYKFTKRGDSFLVDIKDLKEGSHAKVKVICDYCGKEYTKIYKDYFTQHKNGDCCAECEGKKSLKSCELKNGKGFRGQKLKEITYDRYGVENIAQVPEIMQRIKHTNLERYGYENALLIPENREKCIQRTKEEETQLKKKKTNILKYGFESPLSNPKIREKIAQSYYKNGKVATSSQQMKVYKMIKELYGNGELNYPCGRYSLDCALFNQNVKIDIEYDGNFWHKDKERDMKRDSYVSLEGYKILRIKGNHEVPSNEELKNAIDTLLNTEQNFIELIIE